MIFHTFEHEGDLVFELDEEGIDWLIQGLEQLRSSEPGTEISSPAVSSDENGVPEAVGAHILLRAEG
jgi:hypothetical protein